jgi:hypothetical protein
VIRAAWVTLKLHRIELLVAVTVALVTALWAIWVEVRASGINIPAGCLDAWMAAVRNDVTDDGACTGPVRAWGTILAEAGDNFRQTTEFLPFVIGALVGVPIVAGEIEGRTTGMAWSLNPSRTRWLVRQVVPVALVTGLAVLLAGVAAETIEHDHEAWGGGYRDVTHIGHYGLGLVARAFGVFGIGLGIGALLGRQLPAFLLSIALGVGFLTGLTGVRDAWFASHETHVLGADYGVATDWAWRTPDGVVLSKEAATALVPPDLVAQDEGQVQPVHAAVWLEEHGYTEVSVGISIDVAMGWAPLEGGAYVLLGVGSIAVAVWLVNRRRPA